MLPRYLDRSAPRSFVGPLGSHLIVILSLMGLLLVDAAVASAASMNTRVTWNIRNNRVAPLSPGINESDTLTGAGERVGFSGASANFALPGGGIRGPIPEITAFAEVSGRTLRAYAEVNLSGGSCDQDGVQGLGCGFSTGNSVLWFTSHAASATAGLQDDLLIMGGPDLVGLSGLLQIPVTTTGRLFHSKNMAPGGRASLQTTMIGRTVSALPGQQVEDLIDSFGVVNVRFTFGEQISYGLSLEANVNGLLQVDSATDANLSIADFSNSLTIGMVEQLRVDLDSNGSFETTLNDGFSIQSGLGINYLVVPEPSTALLLGLGLFTMGVRVRREN